MFDELFFLLSCSLTEKLAREIIPGFYARRQTPLCDTHFDIYTIRKVGITRRRWVPFQYFSLVFSKLLMDEINIALRE